MTKTWFFLAGNLLKISLCLAVRFSSIQIPASKGFKKTSLWRKPRLFTWACCDFSFPGLLSSTLTLAAGEPSCCVDSMLDACKGFDYPGSCELFLGRTPLLFLPIAKSIPNCLWVVYETSWWTSEGLDVHMWSIFFLVYAHLWLRVKGWLDRLNRRIKSLPL